MGDSRRRLRSLLEFCEHDDVAEKEQVSLLGLGAFGDLNTLIQQQLSVLTGQTEDERTLLRSHPAGGLFPKNRRDRSITVRRALTLSNSVLTDMGAGRILDLLSQNVRSGNKREICLEISGWGEMAAVME